MTSAPPADSLRQAPVDAATLVLVDRSGVVPRILMGRRHANLAFMPNKFVFPGGRVDVADQTAPSANELTADVCALLQREMAGEPSALRARALGIAAIRETREETGVILGEIERPPLATLHVLARAITPPSRPRRYDTRFFIADAAHATQTTLSGDGELSEIAWVTLAEMSNLDLPKITRLIGGDIAALLAAKRLQNPTIPFYQHGSGQMERGWL